MTEPRREEEHRHIKNEEEQILEQLNSGQLELEEAYEKLRAIDGLDYQIPPRAVAQERVEQKGWAFSSLLFKLKEVFVNKVRKPKLVGLRSQISETKMPKPEIHELFAKVPGVLLDIAALAILFAIIWLLISPILGQGGYAPGFDTPSHMYITERLGNNLRQTGNLPKIDLDWYAGLEITHKLPPLTYIPLVAVYLITDNAMLTSRLFFLGLIALMGLSMYLMVRLSNGSRLGALGAAVIVPLSAASIGPQFSILVSFTRYFAFLLFPWALLSAKRLLDGRRVYWLVLAAIIALMLPTHPMVAPLTAVWLFVYAFFRTVIERKSLWSLRYFVYAFALSGILSAWYLGPFLLEEPVWGIALPNSIATFTSMPFMNQARALGLVFGLAVVAAMLFRYSADRLAILLASIFGFVYALGVYGPVFRNISSLRFAYPFMMFFCSFIALTYLIFTSVSLKEITGENIRKWGLRLGASALVVMLVAAIVGQAYRLTDFTFFETSVFSWDELQVTKRIRGDKTGGRVMPVGPPYGLIVHAIPLLGKKPTPEGQYTTIAPFYLQITAFYDYLKLGYLETAVEKLRLWNSNFVVLTRHVKQRKDFQNRKFKEVLTDNGFAKIYENNSFQLFRSKNPSSYFQEVTSDTLIIGQWPPVFTSLSESSIGSGKSFFLDDYSLADLKHFKTLVLHGFAYKNKANAEDLIRRYVNQGGQVVVDAQSGDEFTIYRRGSFLGVDIHGVSLSGKVPLKTKSPNSLNLPQLEPLSLPNKWHTIYYTNLDRTLVTAQENQRSLPVVGYKKVGSGKVYFLGGNLLFYGFSRHEEDISKLLGKIIDSSDKKKRALVKPDVDQTRFTATSMDVTYRAKRSFPALISRTYSPHWRVELDGKKMVPINKVEGLIQLNLPGGKHRITMYYGRTAIHTISKVVTALGFLIVLIVLFKLWRRNPNDQDTSHPPEPHATA